MPRNRSWFSMKKQSDDYAEIEIFDEIDSFWGLGPKEFKDRFDEIKDAKSIKLLINSPGGNVFDGMAIANILSQSRAKLDIEVVGLAASISSIIALSGKSMTMAEGSYLMIHDPYTLALGGAGELRKTADLLDTMKGEFISIYARESGLDEDEISKMMSDETWLTASQAVEKGFASGVVDYGEVAAKAAGVISPKYGFSHVPNALASEGEKKKVTNPRELEDALRDLGFSKKEAVAIASTGWKAVGRGDPEPEQSDSVPETNGDWIKLKMEAELALAGVSL